MSLNYPKKKIIFFRKTAKMVKKTRLFEKMKSVNIDVGKQQQYATVRIKLHTSTLLSRNMSVLSAFTWRYNPNYLFSEEFSYYGPIMIKMIPQKKVEESKIPGQESHDSSNIIWGILILSGWGIMVFIMIPWGISAQTISTFSKICHQHNC